MKKKSLFRERIRLWQGICSRTTKTHKNMLNTLMTGIIAQEVAKTANTSTETANTDVERFKEILTGSPLTPIEEIALMGLLSTICASDGEKDGILSMFNL